MGPLLWPIAVLSIWGPLAGVVLAVDFSPGVLQNLCFPRKESACCLPVDDQVFCQKASEGIKYMLPGGLCRSPYSGARNGLRWLLMLVAHTSSPMHFSKAFLSTSGLEQGVDLPLKLCQLVAYQLDRVHLEIDSPSAPVDGLRELCFLPAHWRANGCKEDNHYGEESPGVLFVQGAQEIICLMWGEG